MKKTITLLLALTLLLGLAGCGGKAEEPKHLDVKALYESYTQYLPEMFEPDEATMLDFLGIAVEDCVQYQVAICAEGMRSDEIWLIEAKDEAALERLHQLAENRIQAKLEEAESYVPDQYAIIEKAELLTNGRYLALLVSPEVDDLKAGFLAAFA